MPRIYPTPCSATSAGKSINYAVEHQCPQCGAPVTLGEDTRFFVCEFCRVRSCIAQKGFPRYYLSPSPDIPRDADLFYLPYWRFKGVRYPWDETGVKPRFMDISALALEDMPPEIPFSLGFRSQALTLKLISREPRGSFIRPLPSEVVLKEKAPRSRAKAPVFKEDIGETFSLIYSPFYSRENELMDGVLNRPLGQSQKFRPSEQDLCRPWAETHFIPGLCPGCGWDLEGRPDSLALVCRNCHSLWRARGNQLSRIKARFARPGQEGDIMVPFWKIRARISPMILSSYADLARQANLPKTITTEWENQPLFFWSPAFKIQPKIFLRLLTQMVIAQPDPPFSQTLPKNIYQPVTLPPSEAVQTVRITMASLFRPLKDILEVLPLTDVEPAEISLVFLPFESRHHEIFHPELNVAINRNVLALSGNL
ncbi:hypothetical protein [Desulfospira joergensenii]|uniref:hypothetical protein n=1 Tax=Desulfospira joergensenii TaxID=53329 RepID=UPI0003B78FBB|nr:hypothetical protein [Desulfospira joergensenii]